MMLILHSSRRLNHHFIDTVDAATPTRVVYILLIDQEMGIYL